MHKSRARQEADSLPRFLTDEALAHGVIHRACRGMQICMRLRELSFG